MNKDTAPHTEGSWDLDDLTGWVRVVFSDRRHSTSDRAKKAAADWAKDHVPATTRLVFSTVSGERFAQEWMFKTKAGL